MFFYLIISFKKCWNSKKLNNIENRKPEEILIFFEKNNDQLNGKQSNSRLRANVLILLITSAANWSILTLLLFKAIFFLNPYWVDSCDAKTKSCKSSKNTRTNRPS